MSLPILEKKIVNDEVKRREFFTSRNPGFVITKKVYKILRQPSQQFMRLYAS